MNVTREGYMQRGIEYCRRTALGLCVVLLVAGTVLVPQPSTVSAADTDLATIGMPFNGQWAYNAVGIRACGAGVGQTSHPSCHEIYGGGDWAIDYYAADGTDVNLYGTSSQGTVTFHSGALLADQSCGQGVNVSVRVNDVEVGVLYVTHLDNAAASTALADGGKIGDVRNACFGVDHVHFEYDNIGSGHACYVDYSTATNSAGMAVSAGAVVGKIGATGATNSRQTCPSSSVAGTPSAVSRTSSSFDVLYRSTTGGLKDTWWDATVGWHTTDITAASGTLAVAGDPKAISRSATSMEVFYRDTNNRLSVAWWDASVGWFANPISGADMVGNPAPISRVSGTTDVIYRNSGGQIVDAWWTPGTGWNIYPLYGMPVAASDPTVVSRSTTSLDVIFRAANGQLVNAYWNAGSGWGWNALPGTTGPNAASGNPKAYSRTPTSIDVLYRNVNGQLVDEWWDATAGWNNYVIYGTPVLAGDPYVASRSPNNLDVLYRDIAGNLVDTSWHSSTGWYTGPAISSGLTENPFPIHRASTMLDVFYKSAGNRLVTASWTQGQSGWNISGALD